MSFKFQEREGVKKLQKKPRKNDFILGKLFAILRKQILEIFKEDSVTMKSEPGQVVVYSSYGSKIKHIGLTRDLLNSNWRLNFPILKKNRVSYLVKQNIHTDFV